MDTYRQEIIESQKTRSDLLKWKLVLCAVLGSVGLGVGIRGVVNYNQSGGWFNSHVYLILCLIPFVCAYVDLLCYHQNLKMLVLASFLKDPRRSRIGKKEDSNNSNNIEFENYSLYEKICEEERDAFDLESLALKGSTIFLSFLLISIPFFIELDYQKPELDDGALILSGCAGILIACFIEARYENKCALLNQSKVVFDKDKKEISESTDTEGEQTNRNSAKNASFQDKLEDSESFYLAILRAMRVNTIYLSVISLLCFAIYWCAKFQPSYYFDKNFIDKNFVWSIPIIVSVILFFLIFYYEYEICKKANSIEDAIKEVKNKNDKKVPDRDLLDKCYFFLIEEKFGTDLKSELENVKICTGINFIIAFVILILIVSIKSKLDFLSHLECQQFSLLQVLQEQEKRNFIAQKYLSFYGLGIGSIFWTFVSHCFFLKCINKFSSLKSFIPKQLGAIKAESLARIELNQENEVSPKPVEFITKAEFENRKNKKNDNGTNQENESSSNEIPEYLMLLRCANGIAIINPTEHFINTNKATSDKGNVLKRGEYWEIKYNFKMEIVLEDDTKSKFVKWQKRYEVDKNDENKKEFDGIEIGEETALFFVYVR